ncbi:MAG: PorV/PorQ family protein [Candidatus Margulisiibacteriota bacterium]
MTLPAVAQGQAGLDLAILNAGVGARPLGMGSAFTAIADNADAPYWNPAGLGLLNKSEITTMQTRLSSDTDHYYVSYIQPALGGTLGISWVQVGLGNINQTSAEVDFHNEVQNISIFSYFSNAYLIAYGKELSDKVSLGLTAKYLNSDMTNIAGGQGSGYSVTPGLLITISKTDVGTGLVPVRTDRTTTRVVPTLTLGIKVDELINQQQWGTGTIERVPPKLRLGLAYKEPRGSLAGSLFALDLAQTIKPGYSPELSGGYEYSLGGLSLRLGYADSGLTAGAGFQVNHTRVDYAYVTQRALSRDNVHRISLSGIW